MTANPYTEDALLYHEKSRRSMWNAVILNALNDTTGFVLGEHNVGVKERAKTKARNWFLEPNKDFEEVCYLAGQDPEYVRKNARIQIQKSDNTGTGSIKRQRCEYYEYKGEMLSPWKISKRLGFGHQYVEKKLKEGVQADEIEAPANKRTTNKNQITFNGETHSAEHWSKIYGISSTAIRDRIKLGWTIEAALTTPPMPHSERAKGNRSRKKSFNAWVEKPKVEKHETVTAEKPTTGSVARYTFNGVSLTLTEWSEKTGISMRTLRSRISYGWPMNRLFTPAIKDHHFRAMGRNTR